jgi:hypothetical protein
MRFLAVAVLLAAATPAAAQLAPAQLGPIDPLRQSVLEFQAQDLQRRSVDLDNQLMALEARLRAEQGIAVSRQQSARPYISEPYLPSTAAAVATDSTPVDTSKLVSIPDDRLAASNAAVRAVTQPQRR